jgi:signal transduction histidine kinase
MPEQPTDWAAYLHKGPIQVLSAAVLRLNLLKKQVDPSAQPAITQIEEAIKEAITNLQTMMSKLKNPEALP